MRYLGHADIVKFLIRDAKLSDNSLREVFENGCGEVGEIKDMVLLKSEVRKGDLKWEKEICITADTHFSAMQRATAFPIASVASLIAEGKLEGDKEQRRDYHTQYPMVLTYKEVPKRELIKKLGMLNLEL